MTQQSARGASWASDAEEKRCATPVEEQAAAVEDDRSVVILTTNELEPLENPSVEVIALAMQQLQCSDDWLVQHEAITQLRRAIVHHMSSRLTDEEYVCAFVPLLATACDNLRSALAKNALLALSECFEYLGFARLQSFLVVSTAVRRRSSCNAVSSSEPALLLDVLLRKSTCEKRFLRDAALEAVDQLIQYLASPELIACAAPYATNKNAKVVAIASKIISQSFRRLSPSDLARFTTQEASLQVILAALARFRAGKESTARSESLVCLKMLGESIGNAKMEAALQLALGSDAHTITSILSEVFPSSKKPVSADVGRRGSLRDRMMVAQRQSDTSSEQ
ncbi:hypothetical protein Poli38472_007108 [Pythium oligandrum]|uniref:TOG domain-containing protein n=1 Tax=Pythium oligandrum TaxID=41045 RepID=A0A8K1FHP3_PYTOL|nr:hypothetical protein Poli38472_007108 [Pythium oligandrum]|eukprot:TMW58963.1 hypothetical protein Poli38472_007108 [Pythium oligandrum]